VVKRLLTYGQQVEGLLRNASTHAAGVVIGDRPLDELVPLYRDPRSDMPATQFNMKWVEQAGLVKFDFLGLKTLTVIQNAVDLIHGQGRSCMSPPTARSTSPTSGPRTRSTRSRSMTKATYELYASAKTVAVFQVESSGMMDALRRMKPTCIEDIVALVALYRPGPMENIPKYCEVKNGLRERETLHPSIDHILDETQGIIVYQEQVMQIAQEMAGYAWRRRPAAPRHGQEDPGGDGRRTSEIPERRGRERGRRGKGAGGLEPARQVRQLRLQQVPRRRLCRGQLPDRLAQGEPPGRVHGRVS
jgi:DNA polymerase-3 subunit alpha